MSPRLEPIWRLVTDFRVDHSTPSSACDQYPKQEPKRGPLASLVVIQLPDLKAGRCWLGLSIMIVMGPTASVVQDQLSDDLTGHELSPKDSLSSTSSPNAARP